MVTDERGVSLSTFVGAVMLAIFLAAGLVVDGTARVQAHRTAEVVAARAVRSGCDAGAASRLVGRDGTAEAVRAARQVLSDEGMDGEVAMEDGLLRVTTRAEASTTFLGLLGVKVLHAQGSASGELRRG
ncbi:hypothetical protein [Luteococcus sp. OSA5]|uniref:hypothetical protein n=1 Tax=Luteococcus sp. OSA5 TaxID=3401630 RepID=UPI003B4369FE